jgi:hypothetical protein
MFSWIDLVVERDRREQFLCRVRERGTKKQLSSAGRRVSDFAEASREPAQSNSDGERVGV